MWRKAQRGGRRGGKKVMRAKKNDWGACLGGQEKEESGSGGMMGARDWGIGVPKR